MRRFGARTLFNKESHWQRNQHDENAQSSQGSRPAKVLRQPVCQQRRNRTARADPEIRKTHRLTSRLVEPARDQYLVGQRSAANVAERVEEIEEVEEGECRRETQA